MNLVIFIIGLIILSSVLLFFKRNKKEKLSLNFTDNWKINYLKKIYPLGTNFTTQQFDNLDCLFSDLLPDFVKEKLKHTSYGANLPGPSCGELPCPCDKNGIPLVSFAPNPILRKRWPPCNIPGKDGIECCKSISAYKKCFKDGKVKWDANDTWTGNEMNKKQKPPNVGQVWKPTLWPKYSLAVNRYSPTKWNSFIKAKGNPDNSWVEGLHSAFSTVNKTYGVWFYRSTGSGIFINLGRTFAALNKIEAIAKLWEMSGSTNGYKSLADYIIHPNDQNVDVRISGPKRTGLGGIQNLDYWSNGQIHTNLATLKEHPKHRSKSLVDLLKEIVIGTDYEVNRVANTGILDNLIIYLAKKNGFESVQFTVQPNLYTGWTTEIMILGKEQDVYTDIHQIPKSQLRVLDPNNLPSGETSTEGLPCNFSKNFACLYCDAAPATLNTAMNCTEDISTWEQTCKNNTPIY